MIDASDRDETNVVNKSFDEVVIHGDATRQAVKEARKLRNKLKKEHKRNERERKKAVQSNEQPVDRSVTIITKDFAEKLLGVHSTATVSKDFNVEILDFPVLEHAVTIKSPKKHVDNNSVTFSSSGISKTQRIEVNINEIIDLKSKPPIRRKERIDSDVQRYAGNNLDSSKPERKRGKYREVPKARKQTSLKKNIIKDKEERDVDATFKTYHDNVITAELNDELTSFLTDIVRLQDKLYTRDPIKGKSKRRYVLGFHEIKKFLALNRVKLLIFAPDIKVVENGALDSIVQELIETSKNTGVPYVFALRRRALAKLLKKPVPISCIAINNYAGLEEQFTKIKDLLEAAKNEIKGEENIVEEVHQFVDPSVELILNALKRN